MTWTSFWIAYGYLWLFWLALPEAKSVPVVPNFQQGTLKSTTTTKTKVNEVINSYRYRTGYEYTVTGTNVKSNSAIAPMGLVTTTNTLNGVSSIWRGLDPATKPSWTIELWCHFVWQPAGVGNRRGRLVQHVSFACLGGLGHRWLFTTGQGWQWSAAANPWRWRLCD